MNSLFLLAFAFAVTAIAAPSPQLIDVKESTAATTTKHQDCIHT